MQGDYDQIHTENIHYFKDEARKAFAKICTTYHFREENTPTHKHGNPFQITFSNGKVRFVLEGINWGMNTTMWLGTAGKESVLHSAHHLMKIRPTSIVVEGSQIEQLYRYADFLMVNTPDILQGDLTVIDQLDALLEKEKTEALYAEQAEEARRISEGYLKIDTAIGESVWRAPRPELLPYEATKEKFPKSAEVVVSETFSEEDRPMVVTEWKIVLGATVKKDDVICEISTEKVSIDVFASCTGKLVWILEEGIPLGPSRCIALVEQMDKTE